MELYFVITTSTNLRFLQKKERYSRNKGCFSVRKTALACIILIRDENIRKEALELMFKDPRVDPNYVYSLQSDKDPKIVKGMSLDRSECQRIDSILPYFLDHPKFELEDRILTELIETKNSDKIKEIMAHPSKVKRNLILSQHIRTLLIFLYFQRFETFDFTIVSKKLNKNEILIKGNYLLRKIL